MIHFSHILVHSISGIAALGLSPPRSLHTSLLPTAYYIPAWLFTPSPHHVAGQPKPSMPCVTHRGQAGSLANTLAGQSLVGRASDRPTLPACPSIMPYSLSYTA